MAPPRIALFRSIIGLSVSKAASGSVRSTAFPFPFPLLWDVFELLRRWEFSSSMARTSDAIATGSPGDESMSRERLVEGGGVVGRVGFELEGFAAFGLALLVGCWESARSFFVGGWD